MLSDEYTNLDDMSVTNTSQSSTDIPTIEELVKAFLNRYKYLYEVRLQNLVYAAELYTVENYDTRLTTVDFQRNMYGAYSDSIHKAIESVTVEKDIAVRDGVKTPRYLSYGVEQATLTPKAREVVQSVHTQTKSTPTSEIKDTISTKYER